MIRAYVVAKVRLPGCALRDLRVWANGVGGGTLGTWRQVVLVQNRGRVCTLAHDGVAVTLADDGTESFPTGPREGLAPILVPGETLALEVSAGDICPANNAGGAHPQRESMTLTVHGASDRIRHAAFEREDRRCPLGDLIVRRIASGDDPNEDAVPPADALDIGGDDFGGNAPNRYPGLRVHLVPSLSTSGGSTYDVTLSDPGPVAIDLTPCPAFTQVLARDARVTTQQGLLPCSTIGRIAARTTVRITMRLPGAASVAATTDGHLGWAIVDGPGASS